MQRRTEKQRNRIPNRTERQLGRNRSPTPTKAQCRWLRGRVWVICEKQ